MRRVNYLHFELNSFIMSQHTAKQNVAALPCTKQIRKYFSQQFTLNVKEANIIREKTILLRLRNMFRSSNVVEYELRQ